MSEPIFSQSTNRVFVFWEYSESKNTTYMIFLNISLIGEGRGERRITPGTKGRNLPNSCLASPFCFASFEYF
jgi:hypothetical protein